MSSAKKSLGSTAAALQEEKPGTLRQQKASMTWEDVLAMPENTVEEMDLKLKELRKREVRPLSEEEIEELRRESREFLAM